MYTCDVRSFKFKAKYSLKIELVGQYKLKNKTFTRMKLTCSFFGRITTKTNFLYRITKSLFTRREEPVKDNSALKQYFPGRVTLSSG